MKTNKVLIEVNVPEGFDPVLCMKITNLAGQTPFSFRVVDQPAAVPEVVDKFFHQIIHGDFMVDNSEDLHMALMARDAVYSLYPTAPDMTSPVPNGNLCNCESPVCLGQAGKQCRGLVPRSAFTVSIESTPPAAPAAQPIATMSAERMREIAHESLRYENRQMVPAQPQEPIAWESTTPAYTRYVTDTKYKKFTPTAQSYYKPYKCASCMEQEPAAQSQPIRWLMHYRGVSALDICHLPETVRSEQRAKEIISQVKSAGFECWHEALYSGINEARQDEVFYITSPCVKEMVDRFLGWKLPKDFAPDCGISFERTVRMYVGEGKTEIQERPHDNGWWPTGTNLFTAEQARELFSILLAPQPSGVTSRD